MSASDARRRARVAADEAAPTRTRPRSTRRVHVDPKGIDRRAIQITRGGTGVGAFFLSRDGRTVYFSVGGFGGRGGGGRGRGGAPAAGESDAGLYSVGIDGRDRRRIAAGAFAGMQPTADRRAIYFRGAVRAPAGDDAPPQGRGGAGAKSASRSSD